MNAPIRFMKKTLVTYLVYALAIGPLSAPAAYAASGDYSNVPLPAKQRPNPNMIMAIDDSGSMDDELSLNANDGAAWFYTAGLTDGSSTIDGLTVPGFWGLNQQDKQEAGVPNFNNLGAPSGTWKKYVYLFPNGVCGSKCDTRSYPDADQDHFAISPSQQFGSFRSPDYNKQYYNPTILYLPWKPYGAENAGNQSCLSGTQIGTGSSWLCTPGNANPKATRSHPMYGTELVDLTQDVPLSTSSGRYFRMYDGMRILPGAKFRTCNNTGDGSGCGSWTDAGSDLWCVGSSGAALTVCQAGGVSIPSTRRIDMNASGRDHVEMAVAYYAARYFIGSDSTWVKYSDYSSFPVAAGYGPKGQEMRMVEIRSSTNSYPKAPTRTDCAGATCTYAEEIQNFANWYQYYRKRHMSLNAAIGNSLDGLNALRAGYFLFNDQFNVKMYDFDLIGEFDKNERALLNNIYRTKGTGGTPTRDTMDWLGNQFMRKDKDAPVQAPCQFNGGFIITDGFATSGGPTSSSVANYDGKAAGKKGPIGAGQVDPLTNTPLAQRAGDPNYFNQQMGITSVLADPTGSGVTTPFADKWSDTLADMAMRFYQENIRPDLPTGKVALNYADVNPYADKNPNLHMNTYGLVLGLSGLMFQNSAYPNENIDPYKNPPNWNGWDSRSLTRNPSAIDELWHATINGRGKMLKADSPEQTRNAVLDVVNNIVAKGGAAAAVSVSNAIPTAGDNFTYQTAYNAGAWSGDLDAFTIDLVTGAVSPTPVWPLSAQQQVADRDWKSRLIVTTDPAAGIFGQGAPFTWATLNATQQAALQGLKVGTVTVPGDWVADWLRGDRSREGEFLRSRGTRKDPLTGVWTETIGKTGRASVPYNVSVLGDLVNAEPLYVREPRRNYGDAGYSAFKTLQANRTRVLYVPGNDGLVHVFDGTTGAEKWAYVPSFGFNTQTGFTNSSLRNLADKEYFTHRFLADATAFAGDFDTATAGTPSGSTPADGSSWKTILVGGLGKGGRGWYALDATDPNASDLATAAAKVMWEFPNKATVSTDIPNLGYSFGRPLIVKTRALGWVVLVSSGYENGDETGGDGRGHLFVLNPLNGAIMKDLTTVDAVDGAANPSDRANKPRGLAYFSAFASNAATDPTIDAVYGGDLYGNVWRFDLSSTDVNLWTVRKLATLTDASGNPQPITTEPELADIDGNRMVFVGTGRYFGDKDIPGAKLAFYSATGTQSMYALKDDLSDNPTIAAPRSALVKQTLTKTGNFVQVTNNTVDLATSKGWFLDFPDTGERVITNPTIATGVLSFTTNIPDGTDPCLPGGRSWLYSLDFRSGSFVPGASYAGRFFAQALASRVNVIRVGTGLKGLIRTSAGKTETADTGAGGGVTGAKRKSWREVFQR